MGTNLIQDKKREALLDLISKAKDLVITRGVIRKNGYSSFSSSTEFYKNALYDISDLQEEVLLTALMIQLGYKIPRQEYYTIDFSDFCAWLDGHEENGEDVSPRFKGG